MEGRAAWATLVAMLAGGAPVIANVMHGHHFVLVVGYAGDGDTLYVNDPGFERSTYSFAADVVGWRLYNVSAPVPVEGGEDAAQVADGEVGQDHVGRVLEHPRVESNGGGEAPSAARRL